MRGLRSGWPIAPSVVEAPREFERDVEIESRNARAADPSTRERSRNIARDRDKRLIRSLPK